MNTETRKVYNTRGVEVGAYLSLTFLTPTSPQQKESIENALRLYAINELYPDEKVNIFSNTDCDTPGIVALLEF